MTRSNVFPLVAPHNPSRSPPNFRDQIVPPLELNVYLRPCRIDSVSAN